MDAKTIRTPAPWMSGIRTDFEDMSDEITSSYYDLCNRSHPKMSKIVKVGQLFVIDMQLVLHLDVFQSALSVATSNHFTSDHYSWEYPKDLIEPDICLHIRLDEQVRAKRVRERGGMTDRNTG